MKIVTRITLCLALVVSSWIFAQEPKKEKVAIQIVWDRSGSMDGSANDENGERRSKSSIAQDAFTKIVTMINDFVKTTQKDVYWGIITFNRGKAEILQPLVAFNGKEASNLIYKLPKPDGGTPLGEAINEAYLGFVSSPMCKNHIFVLTDGQQNGNMDMKSVIEKNASLAQVYFVAFDVGEDTFSALKDKGVLVVEASDGKQLLMQVQMVFETKILLEKEE